MAVIMSYSTTGFPPNKRQRRTATTVLAGYFDHRPSSRDVLTSVLNGVPLYKEVEKDQVSRRDKRREKKERDRQRKRAKAAAKTRQKVVKSVDNIPVPSSSVTRTSPAKPLQPQSIKPSSFWRARPAIHIATNQRSMSVTPPPMPLSPQSTPGPSSSSTTSVTSSKRPRTPEDDYEFDITPMKPDISRPLPKKRRVAVKKGWKGWVEGSPPPSEKLINLDEVQVLRERKTRSGKSFDGIGLAKDDWI